MKSPSVEDRQLFSHARPKTDRPHLPLCTLPVSTMLQDMGRLLYSGNLPIFQYSTVFSIIFNLTVTLLLLYRTLTDPVSL